MEVANQRGLRVGDPCIHEDASRHEDQPTRLPRHPPFEAGLRRRVEQPPVVVEGHHHVIFRQVLGGGRKRRQDPAGVLRAALAGGAEQHIHGDALVAFEDVPHELVFAARATCHEQHLRDAVDHLDLGHLTVIGGRAIGGGRNHSHGQIAAAWRLQSGHVEPHRDEFAAGAEHCLRGVDHAARCRSGLRLAPRGVAGRHFGKLHADRLTSQPLRLQICGDGESIARKHAGRHEHVGNPHIRRQTVRSDPQRVHGHARLAEGRHRRHRIDAGVVGTIGQHDHAGQHTRRLLVEHAGQRLPQTGLVAAGREPRGPVAVGRRVGS